MVRITSILLAFIITAQAFYNAGVVGYWIANRAYIASSLCENRDKPAKHCNGKCYLKKNLTVNSSGETDGKASLPVLKVENEVSVFLVDSPVLLPEVMFCSRSVLIVHTDLITDRIIARSVFHPPALTA